MATNFPNSLDSLTNPATTDQLNSPSHAAQHANANDAIEQLEAKVGVDGSTVETSHSYKIAQLELDLQNSAGDFIPLSVLGQPSGPAELNADGNLIVPENKIIIEGATADAHELTLQAPDVTSDITVTLPNASGTLAITSDIPSLTGYATENYVSTAISNLVDTAPTTLDTLNELAAALGDDPNYATTITTALGNKVSKAGGDIITASSASVKPLVLKGTTSQSANLFEIQNSLTSNLFSVGSSGRIMSQGNIESPQSIKLGDTGGTFPAKLNIIIGSASIIGATIKAAASQTANLLEFQNSSGTPITFFNSSGGLTATEGVISTAYSGGKMTTGTLGYFNATTFAPSVSPIVVRGAASQTANLFEWQNSNGTVLGFINSAGFLKSNYVYVNGLVDTADNGSYLSLNPNGTNGSSVIATNRNAAQIPFAVKGFVSQTADLQQWQDSAGSVLAKVNSGGGLTAGNTSLTSTSSSTVGLTVTAASGQTSTNIFEVQRAGGGDASFSVSHNYIDLNRNTTAAASMTVYGANAGAVPLYVKGRASQTANLQEWQNSSGSILARITAGGVIGTTQNIYSSRYYYSGNGTDTATSISFIDGVNGGGLNIRNIDLGTPNAGFDNVVPLTISGNINQTANLQNWKNAAGTVLAKVDSTGAMFTITPAANTNTTQVATTAYVQTELADLVNSAPATLDTLNELATALGNDASFSTTVTNSIALKAPLASPDLTGTPTAPTATAGTNTTQLATTAFVKTEITSSVQPGAVYQTSAPSSPAVGQIWIDSDQDVTTFDSNIIRRKSITATEGQTVFTTDLPFIDGFEQVFFNGLLLLKTSDYTTSGGNTVTLTSAAAVSDIVEIVSVTGANSVTTYTQAEVDALLAANTSVAPISISTNTNLAAKKRYFVTSASALTLTLPASPALNDEIQILDASGNSSTYNITVARNANKINGGNDNLIIDTNGGWYTLLYTGSTYGWKVG
jgi:hypothetical protein